MASASTKVFSSSSYSFFLASKNLQVFCVVMAMKNLVLRTSQAHFLEFRISTKESLYLWHNVVQKQIMYKLKVFCSGTKNPHGTKCAKCRSYIVIIHHNSQVTIIFLAVCRTIFARNNIRTKYTSRFDVILCNQFLSMPFKFA